MYKYVLNSVVKISLLFAQYFEYYGITGTLRGAVLSWTHCIHHESKKGATLTIAITLSILD